MRTTARLSVASLLVIGAACYHATIETGLPPSPQTIEKPWASAWVYGLVPPSPVQTMSQCTSGVSKVETQISFVNGLVGILTLQIYTPMTIKVTCAEGRRASSDDGAAEVHIAPDATPDQLQAAWRDAIQQSVESGHPVFVRR